MRARKEFLQLDKTMKIINYTFWFTGMSYESDKRKPATNLKIKLYFILNTISNILAQCCFIAKCVQDILMGHGYQSVVYGITGISMIFVSIVKSVSTLIYEKQVNSIFSSLKSLEKKENERQSVPENEDMIRSEIKFLNRVLYGYSFFNIVCTICNLMSPIIQMILHYIKTNEMKGILVVNLAYPFDAFDNRVFPFVYIHQIWHVSSCTLATSGVDYLFCVFCTYLRIQFRLLRHHIEHLIEPYVSNGRFYANDEFRTKLRDLFKWHHELINTTEILGEMYSISTLINFVLSSCSICVAGFNLVTYDSKEMRILFSTILLLSSSQIFILCLFGDMLITTSMEISDAVYNCRWYLTETSVAKTFLIMLIRAQTPCKVTAYGFVDVNLVMFSKILSTSWSYFSLLNSLYGNV